MKKSIFWLMGLLLTVTFVSSCDESDGMVDPYTDWEVRNQRYIDSIASIALSNQGESVGQWKVIHTYKYPQQGLVMGDVDEYVYCKVLQVGNGTTPLFTDTVSTHYRGKLIPLYDGSVVTFDQSYRGELDADVAMGVDFVVNGVIEGWTTALQEMKEGDRWEIYIPSELGYGAMEQSTIPKNSTLIFDVMLDEVKPLR